MPPSLAYAVWVVAGHLHRTEIYVLWRMDAWRLNTYMHCYLFSEGAKVLTRQTNERLSKQFEELNAKLAKQCLA